MLARLFRYANAYASWRLLNAETGQMTALPIDQRMWLRLRRRNHCCKSGIERNRNQSPSIEDSPTSLNFGTRDH